ncbi:GNAT family N-acetyltransferase [Acinetobacter sp.]|uniref:GNAT family N-acetyltransferase n=1 Tax=Acinetobacter sp. TaxID=472 RepID=UPI0031D07FF2
MIQIRIACMMDLDAIHALIQPHVSDFIVDETGKNHFTKQSIESLLLQPQSHYFVAEKEQTIVGVIAYRQPAHLLHFFVEEKYQHQGIGRKLWDFVEKQVTQQHVDTFTVNSSCSAQAVYARFGFISVEPVTESRGLRFIPMKKFYTSANITH